MSPFRVVHFPRWAVVVLIGGPFALGALATFVTVRGHDKTCKLRGDLVFVLTKLEDRSLVRANQTHATQKQKDQIKEGYTFMIDHLRDKNCP